MRPATFISVRLQPHRSRAGKTLRPFCGYICTGEEMWALPGIEGLRPALPPQRCIHGKGHWNSGAVITLARHMAMQYLGHLCRPLFYPGQTYRGSQDQLRAPSMHRTAIEPFSNSSTKMHFLLLWFFSRTALLYCLNWIQKPLLSCLGFQADENRALAMEREETGGG